MIIKPGTHILRVRYWLKDKITGIEGTVTKILNSFNYVKNTYYNMTANLDVRNNDGAHYYMWDAQQHYWYGHEWNQGGSQPKISYSLPGATRSNDYPKNVSDPRWYNENGTSSRYDAQTPLFKTLPNVNELLWYVEKGDPHWDYDELWTTMGRLYKSGIWLKKKSKISGFNAEKAPDNTDWRVYSNGVNHMTPRTLPTVSEASQFFFLPALGDYFYGQLYSLGLGDGDTSCFFWTSSASAGSTASSYYLYASDFSYDVRESVRTFGYIAQPFSDFGDE